MTKKQSPKHDMTRNAFAEVSKGLKCIFERSWSCTKAEKYRKEKKHAKKRTGSWKVLL